MGIAHQADAEEQKAASRHQQQQSKDQRRDLTAGHVGITPLPGGGGRRRKATQNSSSVTARMTIPMNRYGQLAWDNIGPVNMMMPGLTKHPPGNNISQPKIRATMSP